MSTGWIREVEDEGAPLSAEGWTFEHELDRLVMCPGDGLAGASDSPLDIL